jgi:two-component system, NtrC family, sensor kinase
VENRSHSEHQTIPGTLSLYFDQEIREDFSFEPELLQKFSFASAQDAKLVFQKKDSRLWVSFPDGGICDFPYYKKNLVAILKSYVASENDRKETSSFEQILKSIQGIEKKIFSSASVNPEKNVKDFWDEILKKINSLSQDSQSLTDLMRNLLDLPFLQTYQTALVVLHLKGQSRAQILGSLWRDDKIQSQVEVKSFNSFFNSIKKSKIKSFHSDSFPNLNLPFNGSFLAKEVFSKKYSLVAITSRHDFLSYGKEEIELFETCIGLLQPHFERLVDQEFSDKKISELRTCLKDFPLPLRIQNMSTGVAFQNDLYQEELQEKDIFFNKKVKGPFKLDLYDSDELRHYAFDLFHFQRISLLGELLNTLRHELSNPLFGLKLSSQIFGTLEVDEDSKLIMQEIEKNVNRCQVIMENFSNLYQIQHESRAVRIKKMVDEAFLLSKSEGREMEKKIHFAAGTETIELNVPLIFVVQILFNLLVNSAQAFKQAGTRGILNINIEKDDNFVRIHIRDNGPGIPSEKLSLLFKPFFTTKAQGTGLGLVLSRNLAIKMGGQLEYINEKSEGAHFLLSLPLP